MNVLNKDGVALHYLDHAGPARPVVLLHGWCCDHTYLADQTSHFADLGHRVIAPDLRGHGASDRPVQTYSMESFADDVVWLCAELHLQDPILVGHSMGGIVAFDVALRYPGLASAIVMLDAAIVVPDAARVAIPTFLEALEGPGYRDALAHFAETALFIPSDDPGRRARIIESMCRTEQHVMISAFEGLRDYAPSVEPGSLALPCLYIAANEPSPRTDLDRTRQTMPTLQYGQTVGSGHFCQMEVPDQVNAMIDRFITISF